MEKTTCSHSRIHDKVHAQLLDAIKRNPRNFTQCIKSKRHEEQQLLDYVMSRTTTLVDSDEFTYSLKTRVYWTVNKIEDWNDSRVRCTVCNQPMTRCNVKKLDTGYKKTCCKECERKLAQQTAQEHLMKKYGVKNVFQREDVIKKLEDCKKEIQQKRESTRRKNNTFKTSKKEEEAYEVLCKVFKSNDVIRQFKDEKRYPFCCDFYIKSQDLFIECNFSWTHGSHWFNVENEDDVKRVYQMRAKKSEYYDNAIETWTVRDLKKRKCAEENHLNYLVFWTLDELKDFYSA